jgi:hypothetical protein
MIMRMLHLCTQRIAAICCIAVLSQESAMKKSRSEGSSSTIVNGIQDQLFKHQNKQPQSAVCCFEILDVHRGCQ